MFLLLYSFSFPLALHPIFGAFLLELRSEEHTSELQSRPHLVCRLLLEKKKTNSPFYAHRRVVLGQSVFSSNLVSTAPSIEQQGLLTYYFLFEPDTKLNTQYS